MVEKDNSVCIYFHVIGIRFCISVFILWVNDWRWTLDSEFSKQGKPQRSAGTVLYLIGLRYFKHLFGWESASGTSVSAAYGTWIMCEVERFTHFWNRKENSWAGDQSGASLPGEGSSLSFLLDQIPGRHIPRFFYIMNRYEKLTTGFCFNWTAHRVK